MKPFDSPPPSSTEPARTESAWLVASFRGGDEAAATALFHRYFARLTALVRGRLGAKLRARVDADDVGVPQLLRPRGGRQFEVEESGDLWRLLARMALHKLSHQVERHTADKRAVSMEQRPPDSPDIAHDLASPEPSPDEAAAVADELEFILRSLNETQRRTLELLEAIAAELGQSERTVRRTLAQVREVMLKRLPDAVRADVVSIPLAVGMDRFRPSRRRSDGTTVVPSLRRRDGSGQPPGSPGPSGLAWEPVLLDHTDFLLQRHIGEGLTGKVYRAWWKSRACEVAVKYLRRGHLNHPERVARFCEEAALVADLKQPNIVALQGLGRAPHGGFFIVFDGIDGPNLQTPLERSGGFPTLRPTRSVSEGVGVSRMGSPSLTQRVGDSSSLVSTLAVQDITRWMADAARAIEFAHQHGVVHCDLKPSNLLLAPDGRVVLTDFGFARRRTADDGTLVAGGTLAFMAPEQLDPSFGEIGPHTDIYGWGAVLFTFLTGGPPHHERRPADLMASLLQGRSPRPLQEIRSDVPDRLAAVCEACLKANPLARPTSLRDVTAGWKETLSGVPC